ncbi:GNAT family N-acetyltransferase [Halalkalirubrum salinum]|uniref:GNAT family N-acetyltransferase n=1 Tax=Halalkalirubrum salinum TaxID=2563889 RepID=UPI002AA2A400|nr:GNAT family N-acetyltransferase [Halalkalirubrum salinum]
MLGWPEDEPTVRLDYRVFSYAGKFVMTGTGKAVICDERAEETYPRDLPALPSTIHSDVFDRSILAAIAFSPDRRDPETLWLRYVTVRRDRRGQGLAPKLVEHVLKGAEDRDFDRASIAVNNPFAYEALYKVGFAFTGRTTGLAELVLERPIDAADSHETDSAGDTKRYQAGLDHYRNREGLSAAERSFLDARVHSDPPSRQSG